MTRQLIIGLDSMEWDLVQKWSAAGKLPTLARLMRDGTRALLATVADRFPDQAWNCLCAGRNPAHFARYFYVQHDPDTGGVRHMPDATPGPRYFWDYLSDAGKRIAVIDVPHVSQSAHPNGYQLSWGTHAAQGPRFSAPAQILHEVDQRFGRHPVGECDSATTERARLALRSRLFDGIKAHGELFRHFAAARDWDVFIAAFGEPHCAGHIYWHDMDAGHPRHDPSDPHKFAGVIEEAYRAVDREVGSIIDAAGSDVCVYIISAHGMGPLYHASWNLQEMLDDWGYGRDLKTDLQSERQRDGSINAWRVLRMVIPGRLQYAIYEALPRRLQNELVFRFYRGNRSWERSRAFAVPNNDTVGAIRINLKGRDRNGIVEPGAEYEELCAAICVALAELTDPVSGKPVAKFISRVHRELRGPYLERLPDITVRWDCSFPWSSIYSPKFGIMKLRNQDMRTGSHSTHGFLIAAGDGIARDTTLANASIYDIAPTILNDAGVAIPSSCEGRPLFSR